jgi:tripartite-type tricarboxylate transporter receptor subunit TctC
MHFRTHHCTTRMSSCIGAFLLAFSAAYTSCYAQGKDFYAGKTVDIVIPGPAGGGPDQAARTFVDYMTRHTAGNPVFVIKAMPGGGGVRALNFLSEIAKPDGLTLLWGPIQFSGYLTGGAGTRYDPGAYEPIGTGYLFYAVMASTRVSGRLKNPTDFMKTQPVNLGGLGQGRSIDFFSRVSLDLLGISYKYVLGYQGQPQIALALQNGEIDISTTGYTGYTTLYKRQTVDTGVVVPIFYHSPIDPATGEPMRAVADAFPADTKHFIEFAKESGRELSGPLWEAYRWIATYETWPSWFVAPKGTAQEALAALREAYGRVIADPEMAKTWRRRFNEEPSFVPHQKAAELQKSFRSISPTALEILKGL